METRNNWKRWMEYAYIVVGALLCAIAVTSFFDHQGVVVGGLSGVAIIIKELTRDMSDSLPEGIPLWFTTVVVNIPLFVMGGLRGGRKFLYRTLLATTAFAFFLGVVPVFEFLPDDLFFCSVAGGVIMGTGLGMLIVAGSSAGGTDLLAHILQKNFPRVSVPVLKAIADGVIVLTGVFIFGMGNALYAVVAIYVESRIADHMVMGVGYSKMVYIISDKAEDIAGAVIQELDRGVTGLKVHGMYTKTEKNMLMCVIADNEIVKLKELVVRHDENAFVIITSAVEAIGEGSIYHLVEKSATGRS